MKIAGIVTLFYPNEEVIGNIESYLDDLDCLYVIDNTPCKENRQVLPKNKKIKYLAQLENIGVAKALNIGATLALADQYEWLLTMDQDSRFQKGHLNKMVQYIEKNNYKEIGLISPWHVISTGIEKPKDDIDYPLEVMTSGNMVNLEAYKDVGGYKEEYFIDDIDIEFCMNLNVHGYKVVRLNYVELKHDLGDSELKYIFGRKFVCSNHNALRRYYMVRNTFYLCYSYKSYFPDYCSFLKRGLRGQLQNVILFEKDKYKKIRNMIRGYCDYKKGVSGKYKYKN